MKHLNTRILIPTFALTLPLLAQPTPAPADTLEAAANAFIDRLVAEDYDAATERFDATMTRVMTPAKLKQVWQGLRAAYGPLQDRGASYRENIGEYEIIYVPCRFESQSLDAKVVFDREKRITGLFFVPPRSVREYKPPAYVKPKAFVESEVTVGDDPWKLPGTLAVPVGHGPFPAVVLVHGSGPNDRDETVGLNKPFRDLGAGLASRGIVTLRYDKRTKAHGAGLAASKTPFTVRQETVDDAVAAVALLRGRPSVDKERVFVIGHS
ncbi:MAG: alpha/beta hydrolase, partial [Planctomycetota bacterium]